MVGGTLWMDGDLSADDGLPMRSELAGRWRCQYARINVWPCHRVARFRQCLSQRGSCLPDVGPGNLTPRGIGLQIVRQDQRRRGKRTRRHLSAIAAAAFVATVVANFAGCRKAV